jgi:phage-related protein
MSDLIFSGPSGRREKPVVWLHGEVRSPPFSAAARKEAGFLLGRLQRGGALALPQSRPMPAIGPRCHELRVRDAGHRWRIFYRVDPDAVLVLGVLDKKTPATPDHVIGQCRARAERYDRDGKESER